MLSALLALCKVNPSLAVDGRKCFHVIMIIACCFIVRHLAAQFKRYIKSQSTGAVHLPRHWNEWVTRGSHWSIPDGPTANQKAAPPSRGQKLTAVYLEVVLWCFNVVVDCRGAGIVVVRVWCSGESDDNGWHQSDERCVDIRHVGTTGASARHGHKSTLTTSGYGTSVQPAVDIL